MDSGPILMDTIGMNNEHRMYYPHLYLIPAFLITLHMNLSRDISTFANVL
jgi:hypothetical protein